MPVSDETLSQEILRQISSAYSVAPRDVAIAVTPEGHDWRSYLTRIKMISFQLHSQGRLLLIRKRKSITPDKLKGVYRLASPERFFADTEENPKEDTEERAEQ